MANLFSKAKSTATTKTTKAKDDKVRVTINDPDFFDKVQMLETLQDNLKRDKAKADMLNQEIKDLGKPEWVKMYEKTGRNPGSIFLEARSGTQLATTLLVAKDQYSSIDTKRAEILMEKFGEDIVEEKTTFSFDSDMIEKYGEVISRLIEECDEIESEDKYRIIKAVSTFSVAKGTIDRMKSLGQVSELVEEVKPTFALNSVEIIQA